MDIRQRKFTMLYFNLPTLYFFDLRVKKGHKGWKWDHCKCPTETKQRTTEHWRSLKRSKGQHSNEKKKKYVSASLIRVQCTMGTSWVNNWDGVCITLCLSSRRGTQPFNTAASITPHQENDVPLDPINNNNNLKLWCVCLVPCMCVCVLVLGWVKFGFLDSKIEFLYS